MPGFASDIVRAACQIAKCPAFTSQAQFELNRVLESLAQNYDIPAAAYTFNNFPISPNGGTGTGTSTSASINWYPLALPSSVNPILDGAVYLRTKEVFYGVNGAIFYLNQVPNEDYDRYFQGSGITNYPYSYTVTTQGSPVDNTPEMSFYPPPAQPLTLTIRNQYKPNDIEATTAVFAATVPWFPNQALLTDMLAERMMGYTGDQRRAAFRTQIYGTPGVDPGDLSRYLKMMDDKENYAMTVKLDPRRFANPNRLSATKQTVWTALPFAFMGNDTFQSLSQHVSALLG